MSLGRDKKSKLQQALWVFLGYVLLGPVFGALSVGALLILFPFFQLQYFIPDGVLPFGEALLTTFVWSAIPSAIVGAMVVGALLKMGEFSWFVASVAGVLGFGIATFVTDFVFQESLAWLAILAGLISGLVRECLESAKIIEP